MVEKKYIPLSVGMVKSNNDMRQTRKRPLCCMPRSAYYMGCQIWAYCQYIIQHPLIILVNNEDPDQTE